MTPDENPNLYDLVGEQPPVADWSGLVRKTVRRRKQRRQVTTALAVTGLLVLGGASAVHATASHPSSRGPVTLTQSTDTSSESPSTDPTKVESRPISTPTAGSTADPSEAGTPSESQASTASPTSAASTPATVVTPRPQTVVLTLVDAHTTAVVGGPVTWTVHGTWSGVKPLFGLRCDGPCHWQTDDLGPECAHYAAPYTPVPADPGSGDWSGMATFQRPGDYTINIIAASECHAYWQGGDSLRMIIHVTAANPAPSATDTPASDPTRTATATP